MKRVLTTFLLLCSFSLRSEERLAVPERVEIPDPIPVFLDITNVYMDGQKTVRTKKDFQIQAMPRAAWVAKYGPLTEADRLQYCQFGALRIHLIFHHYTL